MLRLFTGLLSALTLFVLATPANAARLPAQAFPTSVYGNLADAGLDGLLVVDHVGPRRARLTIGTGKLDAGDRYRATFGTSSCAEPTGAGQRVAEVGLGVADSSGTLFRSKVVRADGGRWYQVLSARIRDTNSAQVTCVPLQVTVTAPNRRGTDGAYGLKSSGNEVAIESLEFVGGGASRISLAMEGLGNGDTYRFVGSSAACGKPIAGHRAFGFVDALHSDFLSRNISLSRRQLSHLRSLHVIDKTTGDTISCTPLSIIAILIG